MRIGKRGKALIKRYEKLRLKAFRAVKGEKHLTIGWGHYGPDVKRGMTITRKRADQLFVQDITAAERDVSRDAKGKLTQSYFDALVSLRYNIGSGNWRTSNIRKLLKAGKIADIDMEIPKWRRGAGRKILKGLRRRRAWELVLAVED